MKKYKVPVLIAVKAGSRKEAEDKATRFLSTGSVLLHDSEPKIHGSIDYWTLAKLRAKK